MRFRVGEPGELGRGVASLRLSRRSLWDKGSEDASPMTGLLVGEESWGLLESVAGGVGQLVGGR